MKKFTFFLMAALFCGSLSTFAQDYDEIKVSPAIDADFNPTFKFNKDYKYYGIFLDDETREANLDDDQYVYIGADANAGRDLQVWQQTVEFNDPLGVNSFFVAGSYMSASVTSLGWSGIGYHIDKSRTYDLSGINDDYTFHIALKSRGDEPVDFILTDGNERTAHLVFGQDAYDDNEPIADFERDGDWYNIDIPMTWLEDQFGLSFKKDTEYNDKNLLSVLCGKTEGFTIDYDAVFFYGPKGSTNGVKEINAAEKNAPTTIYTVDGKQVSQQYAKANKGIYIVKQGAETKKVVF